MADKSHMMRVSIQFEEYAKQLQVKMAERERKVPTLTEVSKRIATESVHPYEDARKGVKKIGGWKI